MRDAATGFEPTPIEVGGGNNWVPMSADSERDLLFIPTAAPAPNYWGAHRPGDNRYANSIVALRGTTGEVVWHFQTLHHDVWDRDVGSPPILVDIRKDGRTIPSVIQLVKTGMVFAFNRETGEPLFPIEERPVPTDTDIVGEKLSPTQPFPTKPPVLVRNTISPDDAWGFTFLDKNACRKKIESMRHGGHYEPITTKGTIMYPQIGGGANWGGGAFDPARNLLITPVSQIPYYVQFLPRDQVDPEYAKLPEAGGPMQKPGYLGDTPYGVKQGPLMSPSFTPCTKPPWNMLVAVDMAAGEIKWKIPVRQARQADAGADSAGPGRAHGRRADHHGGRPRLHRRHAGQPPARLRRGDRRAAVGAHGADVRHVHAHDLRGQWPAVRGLRRRRPLLVRRQGHRRLRAGLRPAGRRDRQCRGRVSGKCEAGRDSGAGAPRLRTGAWLPRAGRG